MSKLTGIELKRAQLVPSAMFRSPRAVVRSTSLSRAQKVAVLRRWEFDLRQGTDGQAMTIGHEGRLLREVQTGLVELGSAGPSRRRH